MYFRSAETLKLYQSNFCPLSCAPSRPSALLEEGQANAETETHIDHFGAVHQHSGRVGPHVLEHDTPIISPVGVNSISRYPLTSARGSALMTSPLALTLSQPIQPLPPHPEGAILHMLQTDRLQSSALEGMSTPFARFEGGDELREEEGCCEEEGEGGGEDRKEETTALCSLLYVSQAAWAASKGRDTPAPARRACNLLRGLYLPRPTNASHPTLPHPRQHKQ